MVSKLDQRILFENPTITVSAGGGTIKAWDDFAEVWGSVQVEEQSLTDNPQKELESRVKVVVRYSGLMKEELKNGTRLTIEAKHYTVSGFVIQGKRDYITIRAKGVTNGL
jgi:SPP1 family predicted phage head-tail adaptor